LEALRQRVIACLPAEAMFQQIFDVARRYPDVNSDEQTG
jgi:hypothetical protein